MSPRDDIATPRTLPQYLVRPASDGQTFGTLRYHKGEKDSYWEMRAEPQVTLLAKRLFPGSQGRGAGVATFNANRRTFGDLVWLMHRWPLKVESQEAFEKAYQEACEHTVKRIELSRELTPIKPPASGWFKGVLDPYQEEALGWCLTNRRTILGD